MTKSHLFTANRYEPLNNVNILNNTPAPATKRPEIAAIYVILKEDKGSPYNYANFRAALK